MDYIQKSIIVSVLIVLLGCESLTKVSPDFITPCPGLKSDCLKRVVQESIGPFSKGIPSLGLMSTDPLRKDKIELPLPGLKITFLNGVVTGLRKCVVDNVKYENSGADLRMHCNITVKGKYRAVGRLLLFTIDGDGDAKIKSKNMMLHIKAKFQDTVRNGVTYHEVKDAKVDYVFGDRVTFDLTNLFKDSRELSQTVVQFLNENWQQVIDEFGKPVVNTVFDLALDVIKKFFRSVPKDEIIIN